MSLRRRLTRVVRAERAARQPAADPIATLEAAYQRRLEYIDQARRSVADLAVHRRRTELLAEQARQEAAGLDRRAAAAVAVGDDDGARDLLRRGIQAREQADRLTAQHAALDARVRALARTVGALEDRVEQDRLRLLALRADHDAARAALAAQAPWAAGEDTDALAAAEREVRELQARAAAHEELAWTDPDSPRVREALDRLGAEGAVERELGRLRRQVEGRR
ncbi:PspA/IM30 family protein [Georgenia sp. TF02-10]|uniref:PspA/IM30 family protein n=1 Tax=Georgenia sp. TF02-10 TaxID=2917725 RepID=UPI001FA77E1B|nr:PspA/IM30 family protein [Georgenia sp. TF02-10]UNX55074.1 PspA/IM30 family protein [Georgenia sp. TF02-10]